MPRQKIVERLKAKELAAPDGVRALAKHGGNHTKQGDNSTLVRGSTSAAYLIARLKRDAPEYAERLAAGEYRSARAAAIAAGLVVPIMGSMYIAAYIRWIFQRKISGRCGVGRGCQTLALEKGATTGGGDLPGGGNRWAGHATHTAPRLRPT